MEETDAVWSYLEREETSTTAGSDSASVYTHTHLNVYKRWVLEVRTSFVTFGKILLTFWQLSISAQSTKSKTLGFPNTPRLFTTAAKASDADQQRLPGQNKGTQFLN